MLATLTASGSRLIQLTLWQSILGIAAVVVGIGMAWGTVRLSVRRLARRVAHIEVDIAAAQAAIAAHSADIAALTLKVELGLHKLRGKKAAR